MEAVNIFERKTRVGGKLAQELVAS